MPSNIDSVIEDIDDVQDELHRRLCDAVKAAMRVLMADVRSNILDDPHWNGNLLASVSMESETTADGCNVSVTAGGEQAPYAPFVEFGTGQRSNQPSPWSSNIVPDISKEEFRFDSPSINYNESDPFNLTGYDDFSDFVGIIYNWVETKPIEPYFDTFTSSVLIAKKIIEAGTYAHPFLRPAFFQNELQIRQAAKNAVRKAVN